MNTKDPFISIIIPTKNEGGFLPSLLDDIAKQKFTNYEIIIADNNSEDNTREIAEKRGCYVTNGGLPGAGRNRGAAVSQGNYLLFLDADVRLEQGFLNKLVKEIKKRRIDTASGFAKADSKNLFDQFCFTFANCYLYLLQKIDPHTYGCYILIKREVFEKINGFNEKLVLAEDHDLAIRASKVGKFEILTDPKPLVSVRRSVKDGRLKLLAKIIWVEMYRFYKKEVTEEIVVYELD